MERFPDAWAKPPDEQPHIPPHVPPRHSGRRPRPSWVPNPAAVLVLGMAIGIVAAVTQYTGSVVPDGWATATARVVGEESFMSRGRKVVYKDYVWRDLRGDRHEATRRDLPGDTFTVAYSRSNPANHKVLHDADHLVRLGYLAAACLGVIAVTIVIVYKPKAEPHAFRFS